MTQEEKLQKEIERIVSCEEELNYFENKGDLIDFVARHFYEMGKNSDEIIRKELIFALKEEIPQCSIKEHADKLKEFVSYLEKQEPKLAEKQDCSILNDSEQAILRGFLAAGIRNVPVEIIKETAKDCIAHFPWPTKWSKEDENTINELCNIIAANSKNGYLGRHYVGDLVQKLKSLRPQSKQELSKEDGAMLDSVIRIITQFDNLAHEPTFAGPKWTHPYTKELDLLKKLRNRLFEEND